MNINVDNLMHIHFMIWFASMEMNLIWVTRNMFDVNVLLVAGGFEMREILLHYLYLFMTNLCTERSKK